MFVAQQTIVVLYPSLLMRERGGKREEGEKNGRENGGVIRGGRGRREERTNLVANSS